MLAKSGLMTAPCGVPSSVTVKCPLEEVQFYEWDAGGNRVNVSLQELIDRKMGSKIVSNAQFFVIWYRVSRPASGWASVRPRHTVWIGLGSSELFFCTSARI